MVSTGSYEVIIIGCGPGARPRGWHKLEKRIFLWRHHYWLLKLLGLRFLVSAGLGTVQEDRVTRRT
jgi:hypothetical protein